MKKRYLHFVRPTTLWRDLLASASAFALPSVAVLVLAAGCAKVSVRKVPSPTQYVQWTDALQRQADYMEGFRFYLPRPFVNIFESFPVHTEIYLASGMVDPTGKFVILREIPEGTGLGGILANPEEPLALGWSRLVPPSSTENDGVGGLHSGGARAEGTNTLHHTHMAASKAGQTMPVTGEAGKRDEGGTAEPAATTTRPKGNSEGGSGGVAAFAYQSLRDNMDIVYLPDFEEQYVVSSRAALDSPLFRINLGQGWSLQGFDSLEDNRHLNEIFLGLIEKASVTARENGTRALGFPIPANPAQLDAATLNPGLPAGADPAARAPVGLPGSPVSLKIVVVHYAAKGLYPVLKPRELQARCGTLRDRQTLALADGKRLAWTEKRLEHAPTDGAKTGQEVPGSSMQDYTVPMYPYQYISFTTFCRLHLEVLGPAASE